MNVKIWKFLLCTFMVAALPLPGWTGALDRGPMQQRYNQTADEMIRVPGVIGMWESDAMAVLQQAGVVPHIEYEKKYKEDLAGKEGTVIEQEPGAAGITMLGSTVTITVYWPRSEEEVPDDGGNGGPHGDDEGRQPGEHGGEDRNVPYQEPAPQWGDGTEPAGGSGWVPPPAVPAEEPRAPSQASMPAGTVNVSPNPVIMAPPVPGTPGR